MKTNFKILFLLCCSLFLSEIKTINAQSVVLFSQDFGARGEDSIYTNGVVLHGATPATDPASQIWGSNNPTDNDSTWHRDDIQGGWATNYNNCGSSYAPKNCAATGSSYAAIFDNWDAVSYTRGFLISPTINLSSANCLTVFSFYYYIGDNNPKTLESSLALQFNNGSGYTTVWGDTVQTTNPSNPSGPAIWDSISFAIPSAYLASSFQFQFIATAGNNANDQYPVGIDSIVIRTTAALTSSVFSTEVKCNGESNGSDSISVSGGSAPYTYLWQGGKTNDTVNGLTAGTYTVTVHDSCGNSTTSSVIVHQPTALQISFYSGPLTATANPSGGTAPYTYLWTPGNETTETITGLSVGNYTVNVTDAHDCSETASVHVTTTGVDNISANSEHVNIYPNPNNGQFTIAGMQKDMIIEMYDYTGRLVSNLLVNEETMQLNLTNQANGVYLIRIIDKDGNLVSQQKVIKTQ